MAVISVCLNFCTLFSKCGTLPTEKEGKTGERSLLLEVNQRMVQTSFLRYMLRSRSSSGEHGIGREKGEKTEGKKRLS